MYPFLRHQNQPFTTLLCSQLATTLLAKQIQKGRLGQRDKHEREAGRACPSSQRSNVFRLCNNEKVRKMYIVASGLFIWGRGGSETGRFLLKKSLSRPINLYNYTFVRVAFLLEREHLHRPFVCNNKLPGFSLLQSGTKVVERRMF